MHAAWRTGRSRRDAAAWRTVRRAPRLRPHVRRQRNAAGARCAEGGLPGRRWSADASRAGRAAVRVVDGAAAA
ncbi:MAG: hypothetical protein E6H78_21055 [Betaproteobacteria bacterium]|nr:MAG: hypothetical protein E6H78_21055 [Betaproteobacteria bacterium]